MQLDLDGIETRALLNLLVETIEADRYPYSPRISAWIARNSVAATGKPRVYAASPQSSRLQYL